MLLDGVATAVEQAPCGVYRLRGLCLPDVRKETFLDGSDPADSFLRFDQRLPVGATSEVRPAQLHDVVLPEADRADLVGAGSVTEHEVPAAGAREPCTQRFLHL